MIRSVLAPALSDWRSLAKIPLLGMLTEVRLRTLWARSRPHRYVAQQVLRNAGDPATHLLLLLHGRVAATVTTFAGRIVHFGDFAAPCALDKVAVIDGRGHTATLTALTACAVRSLPRDLFYALVDSAPAARRHVLRVLADHARHEQERFAATATLSTETRLAAWLLEQAGRNVGRPRNPSRRSGIPGRSAWRHQGDDQPRADATTARRPHYRRPWPRRHRSPRAPLPSRTRLTCGHRHAPPTAAEQGHRKQECRLVLKS